MIRYLKYPVAFIIAFIIQTALAPVVQVFGTSPDLLLILVVFAALRHGAMAGAMWGFLVGLTHDVYAPVEWLGAGSFALCVVGFLVGQLEEKFLNLNLITKVAALTVAFFMNDAIYFWSIGLDVDSISDVFLKQSLPEGLYTILLGSLAFYFLYPYSEHKHAT